MMEMKKVFEQETGNAKSFIYHRDEPNCRSTFRKPPIGVPRSLSNSSKKIATRNGNRVRSASTGRDKKSELQARYWAFLFGNLNRAVNEIYQTVETYENLSSCQEAILVLENYIREFKALAEWFKVSWDYESTPFPQRPLTWEVRKSNPAPRVRTKTLSSPAISGKSSPNFSGKNSPCPTIDEYKQISRKSESQRLKSSPKNLFPVCPTTITAKGDPHSLNETLINVVSIDDNGQVPLKIELKTSLKLDQFTQTDLEDENLTLVEYLEKYSQKSEQVTTPEAGTPSSDVSPAETVIVPSCPAPPCSESGKKDEKSIPKKVTTVKYSSMVRNLQNSVTGKPPAPSSAAEKPKVGVKLMPKIVSATTTARKPTMTITQNTAPKFGKSQPLPIKKPTTVSVPGKIPNQIITNHKVPPANAKRPLVRNNSTLKRDNVVPSHVENRLTARSKTMIEIRDNRARTNRVPLKRASKEDVSRKADARKSEPKSLPSDQQTNDGWLTVKNKRRSSSSLHWATRFNQPSGYASLPTLTLDEDGEVIDGGKKTVVKEEVAQQPEVAKPPKVVKKSTPPLGDPPLPKRKANSSTSSSSSSSVSRDTNNQQLARQKSDLTGLKLKTLFKEFMRSEKMNAQNTNSTEKQQKQKARDPELHTVDMNVQTSNIMSTAINDLYTNCLNDAALTEDVVVEANGDGDEMSMYEEEEKEDEKEERKLLEEQESLERQIRELESTEIDIDTETDETDCEAIIDLEDNESNVDHIDSQETEADENMSLEMRYEAVLAEMSWVDRIETLATLEALVARHPGRAQQLHQKLSSPSRRRSLHETIKKYQAKQQRAQEKRAALKKEKALKIQLLLARVEDVISAKKQLIEDKRLRMEERLQRAADNRTQFLKDKIRKAHDEEEKMKEIAFIKSMEAQHRYQDYVESCREQEGRLQDLEQERQKKAEEKAAKEAAVEKRRQKLEMERKKRLEKMNETRREREERVGKMQEEKEKQRQAVAREKARDREERWKALQAQQLATTEELQRKIIQKQQESARRHEENIEHIRQRAVELTIPNRNTEDGMPSTPSKSKEDEELNRAMVERTRELMKAAKKKLKKLKQRMAQNAQQYLAELQPLPPHMRKDSPIPKLLNVLNKGGGTFGHERPLGQLLRQMTRAEVNDFQSMWLLDGLGTIAGIVERGMEVNSEISKKAVVLSVQLYRTVCSQCPQIARHAIMGNSIAVLLDALVASFQIPEEKSPMYPVELSTELILACTVAMSPTNALKQPLPKLMDRLPDLISYVVSTGVVDILAKRCSKVRESVEHQQSVVLSLLASLGFLTVIAELCPKGPPDATKFLSMVRSTELFGTIPLLYSTIVPSGECIPPRTISLAAATFSLLITLANLDLKSFQEVLAEEVISLKFLDIVTIVLNYCGPKSTEKGETQAVIVDLIAILGFFCANNKMNQDLLTSEQSSIIIKSLTKLPKQFDIVIYPTLVTIICDNPEARKVLSKDFDVDLLDEYKQSDVAKKNKLVALLDKPASAGTSKAEQSSAS